MFTIRIGLAKAWNDPRFNSIILPGGDMLIIQGKVRGRLVRLGVFPMDQRNILTRPQFAKLSETFDKMCLSLSKYVELAPELAELSPYYPHATAWFAKPVMPLREPTEWLHHDSHPL